MKTITLQIRDSLYEGIKACVETTYQIKDATKEGIERYLEEFLWNEQHEAGQWNTPNKMFKMFNMERAKSMVKHCPKDQVIILCPCWSINQPKYSEEEMDDQGPECDWDEFEGEIGCSIQVNQFDDLVADPHGIMSE